MPRFDMTWAAESSLCAVCLEDLTEPSLRGSANCNHYFHTQCVETWLAGKHSCPICRQGDLPAVDVSDADVEMTDAETEPPVLRQPSSAFSWLWTLLMTLPWPRAQAAPDPEWDASRGIGDWRARLQRIYDAEAAAEAESDDDDDDDEADAAAPHTTGGLIPGR